MGTDRQFTEVKIIQRLGTPGKRTSMEFQGMVRMSHSARSAPSPSAGGRVKSARSTTSSSPNQNPVTWT
jgi:hypothetical protein